MKLKVISITHTIASTALPAIVAILLTDALEVNAQNFASVTTGTPVNDGGASRSVNWIDYDNDGWLDLFVTNGLRQGQNNFLYRNEGAPNFGFTKIAAGPIVNDRGKSDGSSWGDYDNDGDLDAFVVNWYGDNNLFYENNGDGTFTQIFAGSLVNDGGLSETCSWGDYDNDGYLDLYVTNSGDVNQTGPRPNFLYRNNGNRTFTKITTGAVVTDAKYSRGANWVDYDDDGDFDLFVANEENQSNDLYRNQLKESGEATFSKLTGFSVATDAASSWSSSWGDYDNDGDLDLFVANWGNQNDFLYRNEGNGELARVNDVILATDGGYSACSGWGDFDNDGDLDLYVTNAYGAGQLRNFMYRNLFMELGEPLFEKITTGAPVTDTGHSYGFSWGDYDNDGDLDLFVARTLNENQNNAFYANTVDSSLHWLEVRCLGTVSNRSAIGAKIFVKATIGDKQIWQRRDISGQEGYCSQNLVAHWGLGDASVVDSLVVRWPSGNVQVLTNVATRQLLTITEPNTSTEARDQGMTSPQHFKLNQNYPNPFNPETRIEFSLTAPAKVALKIYDLIGNEVRTLVNGNVAPGPHTALWNGTSESGRRVPSGVYFYRMMAGSLQETRKMVLVE